MISLTAVDGQTKFCGCLICSTSFDCHRREPVGVKVFNMAYVVVYTHRQVLAHAAAQWFILCHMCGVKISWTLSSFPTVVLLKGMLHIIMIHDSC